MRYVLLALLAFTLSCTGSQEVEVKDPILTATGEYGSALGISSTLSVEICYEGICAPVEVEFFASNSGVFVCYTAPLFTDCVRVDAEGGAYGD